MCELHRRTKCVSYTGQNVWATQEDKMCELHRRAKCVSYTGGQNVSATQKGKMCELHRRVKCVSYTGGQNVWATQEDKMCELHRRTKCVSYTGGQNRHRPTQFERGTPSENGLLKRLGRNGKTQTLADLIRSYAISYLRNFQNVKRIKKKKKYFCNVQWDERGGRILLSDDTGGQAVMLQPIRFQCVEVWISNTLPCMHV